MNQPSPEAIKRMLSFFRKTTVPRILKDREKENAKKSA